MLRNSHHAVTKARATLSRLRRRTFQTSTVSSQTTSSVIADDGAESDPWRTLITKAPTRNDAAMECDGTLAGWKFSIKDNFTTKDMPMTCSSRMLENYRPTFDASVVSRLSSAGADIVGKSSLDEFAMGSANVHSYFDLPVNPRGQVGDEMRAAGGSSGGAAASVASGVCRVAIGSDTGGSVRLPASYCGVWGLKPSYGLISRWGLVPYADSLDTVGILSNHWDDCSETFKVLSSHDRRDPTSASELARKRAAEVSSSVLDRVRNHKAASLEGVRIGIPSDMFAAELNSQVLAPFDSLVSFLTSQGAEVVSVRLPNASLALSAYYVIASAEASSNLARYDGIRYGFRADENQLASSSNPYSTTRTQGFGPSVRSRILLGTHALTAGSFNNTFLKAQKIRKVIQDDFDMVFRIPNVLRSNHLPDHSKEGVDIILHPCSTNTAPTISYAMNESSEEEYVQDLLTVPSSLAGIPAVSVPTGYAQDGYPVGSMLISQWGMEDVLGIVGKVMKDFHLYNKQAEQDVQSLRPDFDSGLYARAN
ncbi:unnamed protein product [Sympodiomycopsis kandeliae]